MTTWNNVKFYNHSLLIEDDKINQLNTSWVFAFDQKVHKDRNHFSYEDLNLYIYLEENFLNRIFFNIDNIENEKEEIEKILKTQSINLDWKKFYKYKVESTNSLDDNDKKCDIFDLKKYYLTSFSKINEKNIFKMGSFEIFNSNKESVWADDIFFIKNNSWDEMDKFENAYDIKNEIIWEISIVHNDLPFWDGVLYWSIVLLRTI